jgi:transposase
VNHINGIKTAHFAGIDWGGTFHQLCVVDDVGERILQRKISHDVAGLAELDTLLDRFPDIKIAIERAEGLLVERLLDSGRVVFCISPKISARARERYRLAATKSDVFDAFVLADTLRHEHRHWRALSNPSPIQAELKAITRDRDRIIVMQKMTESRLRATLEAYHPAPLHVFSTLDRDITLSFIHDYPTPQSAARVGQSRMERFIKRHHYTGRVPADVLLERMRPHLLSASAGTVAGKQFTAEIMADELRLLNTHLRAYNQRMNELLDQHPDTAIFRSFPGIGPVVAAVLISEMGEDRARFPSAGALLAETGLAPVTRSSGRSHQVRFRYAANRRMRHAIDWWAFVATREDPWSAELYEKARERGQGKYRALRGIGARWTRVLWRCWNTETEYDPARHITRNEQLEPAA